MNGPTLARWYNCRAEASTGWRRRFWRLLASFTDR